MTQNRRFFAGHKILIADDNSATRIAIARCLSEMGASTAQMSLADSFDWAKELISRNNYSILICEYDLGPRCGLDLIDLITHLKLTMVITRNSSEEAAARAAERDVDIFLTKPFTIEAFRDSLESALSARQDPFEPPFEGSDLEISLRKVSQSTQGKFAYDRLGYRSLVGMYEALIQEGRKVDGYAVLRKLVTQYHLNPERLNTALRLAIETRHFDDVDTFHRLFLKVEKKTDELVRHVSAALVMAGKAMLRKGEDARAIDQFRKAAVASGKKPAILREIVASLADSHPDAADAFLTEFPKHERETLSYITLDYLILSKLRPLHEVLSRGHDLIRKGVTDPAIYRILIQACQQAGHQSEAESLALDAARLWPDFAASGQQKLRDPSPA